MVFLFSMLQHFSLILHFSLICGLVIFLIHTLQFFHSCTERFLSPLRETLYLLLPYGCLTTPGFYRYRYSISCRPVMVSWCCSVGKWELRPGSEWLILTSPYQLPVFLFYQCWSVSSYLWLGVSHITITLHYFLSRTVGEGTLNATWNAKLFRTSKSSFVLKFWRRKQWNPWKPSRKKQLQSLVNTVNFKDDLTLVPPARWAFLPCPRHMLKPREGTRSLIEKENYMIKS